MENAITVDRWDMVGDVTRSDCLQLQFDTLVRIVNINIVGVLHSAAAIATEYIVFASIP